MDVKEVFLLTGAGFTKNFGGFLAQEVWARIFNNPEIRKHKLLINFLRREFDFEEVFDNVIAGQEYTTEEKIKLNEIILNVYLEQEDLISRGNYDIHHGISPRMMAKDLMQRFIGHPIKKGFVFTLNQDMFFERFAGVRLMLPGIHQDQGWFNSFMNVPAKDIQPITIRSDIDQIPLENCSPASLIKLHGSVNFRANDGSNLMLIGHGKGSRMPPLFAAYLKLFEEVLSFPSRRLLVIGYSFQDAHINAVLWRCIQKSKLELYIIDTLNPGKMRNRMDRPEGLWDGVCGYFQVKSLADLFPGTTTTADWEYIREKVFR